MNTERVHWLDTIRFLGILSIYIGHFSEAAGFSFEFVFKYHVPLFFFISGCTESLSQSHSVIETIKKKAKSLLIPFIIFSLLSILIYSLQTNCGLSDLKQLLILILKGCIRNTFFAASLWFLTCLFIMTIIFQVIKKLKHPAVILLTCVIIFLLVNTVLPSNPIVTPNYVFNIDSALYYLIYYCLGFLTFNKINHLLISKRSLNRIIILISTFISFGYSALLFFNHDLLRIFYKVPLLNIFIPVITASIVIWLNIVVSYLLQNIKIINEIGKNTLYMCGNEYLVKTIVPTCLQILGLNLIISNPLSVYIYSFFLLILVNYLFVPIQRSLIEHINRLATDFLY